MLVQGPAHWSLTSAVRAWAAKKFMMAEACAASLERHNEAWG